MIFKKVLDLKKEIQRERKSYGKRGWDTGITAVDERYSVVKGSTTNLFSYSGQGKTQLSIQISVNLALKYGVKSAFYFTEMTSTAGGVLDVAQTILGKQAKDITDEELLKTIEWMDDYFYFADTDSRLLDINTIYKEVHEMNKEGANIENVVIDHYHNLEQNEKMKFMDRADKTKYIISTMNRSSRFLGVHTFILFHVRDTKPVQCKTSGLWHLPLPEKESLSGGQQSSYLSNTMATTYRPVLHEDKYGIVNPITGIPYEVNETIFYVAKVKPKGSAVLGSSSIFFDVSRQQFYSKDPVYGDKDFGINETNPITNGVKQNDSESAIKPNLEFGLNDAPF